MTEHARPTPVEVRRESDHELVGHVVRRDGGWQALAVFGGLVESTSSREEAVDLLLRTGLAVLTQPWWFEQDGEWSECVLQEAGPGFARIQPSLYGYPDHSTRPRTLRGPELTLLSRQPR